jgi:hypothetical protein
MRSTCTLSGGLYGYGKVMLKVGATEYGRSGVNKIRFESFLLQSENLNGPWSAIDFVQRTTPYFSNNSASNSYSYKSAWNFGPESQTYYHRIETFITFLKTDGPNETIDIESRLSRKC